MYTDDTDERFSTATLDALVAYAEDEDHDWQLVKASIFGLRSECTSDSYYIAYSGTTDHYHTADSYQELLEDLTRHDNQDCYTHFRTIVETGV